MAHAKQVCCGGLAGRSKKNYSLSNYLIEEEESFSEHNMTENCIEIQRTISESVGEQGTLSNKALGGALSVLAQVEILFITYPPSIRSTDWCDPP